ncbi:cytochrome P450 family protein [Ceratobasidium sp. AG-Ba]|nr:cytochrome P450 family protein [Ceratobasidium sp. AG-Ba]
MEQPDSPEIPPNSQAIVRSRQASAQGSAGSGQRPPTPPMDAESYRLRIQLELEDRRDARLHEQRRLEIEVERIKAEAALIQARANAAAAAPAAPPPPPPPPPPAPPAPVLGSDTLSMTRVRNFQSGLSGLDKILFVNVMANDEVILGRHVPKGTQILIPVGPLSAQESDWGPDAESWRPSRWLRPDGSFDANAGTNLPFGMGQRACFGQRLAMLQLKTFLAALSKTFIFKPVPKEVAGHAAYITITRQPEHCYVSLERWPTE